MSNEQTYSYDCNGNMTSKNTHIYYDDYSPDEHFHTEYENTTRDYGYNLQNKMESYDGKGQTATYVYDGTGTGIGKTVNGVSTGQIWNNGNVIAEYGTRGTKSYILGVGGEIVKTKDSTSNSRYFSYNAHGDTTNIIEKKAESTSFAVTAAYEYDAFGCLVTGTGGGEADSNAFRYNGQYTDEETGLIYLRNRYYDPSIGRFTQEDPYWNPGNMIYGDSGNNNIPSYESISQSANLYVYCASDPVNGADPSGEYVNLLYLQSLYQMYGVTVNVARLIWQAGAYFYLDQQKGWYLTATLLERSTSGIPNQSFVANGGDYAAELVRNDDGFNAQVNNDLWNMANAGYTSVDIWGYYEFDLNSDLGAALHNVSYNVRGSMNAEGRWEVYVSVYDTFDFTEFVIPIGGEYTAQETFLWIVNDAAAISQAISVIQPVDVTINYKQTY